MTEVQAVVWQLSERTSDHFGHLMDDAFRCITPAAYLWYRKFVAKSAKVISEACKDEVGADGYRTQVVLCHGALTQDHIIVDDGRLSGIVGWSQADFVLEDFDRLKYYTAAVPTDPYSWERSLSEKPSSRHKLDRWWSL